MLIQECQEGLRVRDRESGKLGTVKDLEVTKKEALVEFDDGRRVRVPVRLLEPTAQASPSAGEPTGPSRPCPQCAAKMALDETVCPKCGFQYGTRPRRGLPPAVVVVLVVLALAAAAWFVWKHVAHQ